MVRRRPVSSTRTGGYYYDDYYTGSSISNPDATVRVDEGLAIYTEAGQAPVEPDSAVPILAVGTVLTDAAGQSTYKVASNAKANPTVLYTGAKNKNAKKVTVPAIVKINGITFKVVGIAPNALTKMKKLKTVVVGVNVATIGKSAFASCPKLKQVKCNTAVLKSIGTKAFFKCPKLAKLTLKTKLLKSSTVGKQAFKGTSKKLVVKVPKSAKKPYAKFMKKKGNKKLRLK